MRKTPGIRELWVGVSVASIGIGAMIALHYFPGAGFAMHPAGQYDLELVGFTACVTLPLAVAQSAMLACTIRRLDAVGIFWTILWLPFTAAGVAAMILPLWSWDATVFTFMPWMVVIPMLPGALLLGSLQWLAGHWLFGARLYWISLTVVGVIAGSVLGLIVAFMLQVLPLEVTWAALTGAGIAFPQGWLLSEALADAGGE